METLLKVLVAIVALDVILVGLLGVAGSVSRRRAKKRAVLRGREGYLRLARAAKPPPLGSRVTMAALVAAVAFAGAGLVARGVHLMHDTQQDRAVGGGGQRLHRTGSRRSRTIPRTTAAPPSETRFSPGGTRGASTGPSATGTSQTSAPSPGVVTAVPVSATEIKVRWTDVSDETGYRIERSSGEALHWTTIATTAQNVTTYSDAGLPSGTTYYYRVVATSPDGASLPSDVASSTTIALPASPEAVTAVMVSANEIDLSWGDVSDETGFRIERSPDGTTGWIAIATTGQGVTSYSDAGLTASTTYYYRVFATDAGGDSPPSDVASSTTGSDTSSPAAPPTSAPAGP